MVHSCASESCFSRAKTKAQKDQDSRNVDSKDIRFFSVPKGLIHSISLYVCNERSQLIIEKGSLPLVDILAKYKGIEWRFTP